MASNIEDDISSVTHALQDSGETITLTLYANGFFQQRDITVGCQLDTLEITTSVGQKWIFQLNGNTYREGTEISTERNDAKDQTIIKLNLSKQQNSSRPQLHSYTSKPMTSQINSHHDAVANSDSEPDSTEQPDPYFLAVRKLETDFSELTFGKAKLRILIRQVFNCKVTFTETSVTVIFHTDDETFFQTHSISQKRPIRLFFHVKERIVPRKSTYEVTPSAIELNLHKEDENGNNWYRLEATEYSNASPLATLAASEFSSSRFRGTGMGLTRESYGGDYTVHAVTAHDSLMTEKYPSALHYPIKDITYMLNTPPTRPTGYTGIYNPANSCFMNAAVQCLANTRELRDYFLNSCYSTEINLVNPLGMKGVMAEEFASILKNLWSGSYSYINANKLREYVAQRHQEFVGSGQHDAQELITIVLDALHEDLNRVIHKPMVPAVEADHRSDDVIADEYWRGYLSRNDSIIVQLFTGQFKSKTKCPQCHKESVTFDPFTSISVPLPKRVAVDVIVIFRSESKAPTKYRIVMSSDGTIAELKRHLSDKCGVPFDNMLAYKTPNNRSIERLRDDENVPYSTYTWSNMDLTYIAEILTSAECNNETIHHLEFFQRVFRLPDYMTECGYCQAKPQPYSTPLHCQKCYRISYCDETCLKLHASEHKHGCSFRSSDNHDVVGLPFIISLPDSKLKCENVFQQIRIYAKHSVDIQLDPFEQPQSSYMSNYHYHDYDRDMDDAEEDEKDSFSDVENTDWETIKCTLASADSWSIVRIGDYFVKTNKNKRHRQHQHNDNKENMNMTVSESNYDQDELMNANSGGSSHSSEDFDMLDDLYSNQPLFRIMPESKHNTDFNFQPIVEPGIDGDHILRSHTTFSIDWFTDNSRDGLLRVKSSKNRSGFNTLVEDESVGISFSGDQNITLEQCLQLFIEPEVLGPDDKWYCPHCKEHIQAEKKMAVWRLPPILIIHLKRFKYSHYSAYGSLSGSREKIETTVQFPTHDLNMLPYCSSTTGDDQQDDSSSHALYDLFGVVNHRGTAWFGHYTSYGRLLSYNDSTKTEIDWRHFDDQHVSSLSYERDIIRPEAYVLFYRSRNLPVTVAEKEQLECILPEISEH